MTGCSDLFRLLLQGGASLYALDSLCDRTTDIITTIWELAVGEAQHGPRAHEPGAQPTGGVVKFDERVAMTQLALDNDCNIYDANKENVSSGPLFSISVHDPMYDPDSSHMRNLIQYLTSIGYNLEDQNVFGQTPLLYAASQCFPATTEHLGILIERGARLDAKDDFGLGLLHTVLLHYLFLMNSGKEPYPYERYGALERVYWYSNPSSFSWLPDERDMYWEIGFLLRQDYPEDCRLQEIVGDDFPRAMHADVCEYTPSNPNCCPNTESSRRIGLQASQIAVKRSLSEVASFIEFERDEAFCSEESILETNDMDDYVIARNYEDGEDCWIRNPVPLLKARVASKLKILLEAGCDPNVLDDDGLSPSEYAKRGKWLREAWVSALRVTGHTFDAVRDRWIKRSTPT